MKKGTSNARRQPSLDEASGLTSSPADTQQPKATPFAFWDRMLYHIVSSYISVYYITLHCIVLLITLFHFFLHHIIVRMLYYGSFYRVVLCDVAIR